MIITALNISKGAFYHYFKSKEDLMNQLVNRFTENLMNDLLPIVQDENLNGLEKLNTIFQRSSLYKSTQLDLIFTMIKMMFSTKNLFLREKLHQKSLELTVPLLAEVLKQGKSEGLFEIKNPEIAATLIQLLGFCSSVIISRLIIELESDSTKLSELEEFLEEYRISIERLLGAQNDSIKIMDEGFLTALTEFLRKK
jgi:AcrR family transcriptional regulator